MIRDWDGLGRGRCGRNQKWGWITRFFVGCVVAGAVLLFAEALCRISVPDFRHMQRGHFAEAFQIDPLLTAGVFLLDQHTFWRLAPDGHQSINEQGFRSLRPTAVKTSPDYYRIICVGDSITFGVPVELNRPPDTFAVQLEQLLSRQFEHVKIEALNAGVPGYTSYQVVAALQHRLLRFRPDLVVAQFGQNDAAPAVGYPDREQKAPNHGAAQLRNLLGRSALCFVIARALNRIPVPGNRGSEASLRVSPRDYEQNILEMKRLGQVHGFEVLFLDTIEYRHGRLTREEDFSPPPDPTVVDTIAALQGDGRDLATLFADDCHLTPAGHRIVAGALFAKIMELGLVDGHLAVADRDPYDGLRE